jgi:hypothetical protein
LDFTLVQHSNLRMSQKLTIFLYRDAKSTSFTSLSEKVAAIARDLHNGLWCALELETMHTITVQLLKVRF